MADIRMAQERDTSIKTSDTILCRNGDVLGESRHGFAVDAQI